MQNSKLPIIEKVDEKLNAELLKYFKGETEGYLQVGPKKWFLPVKYKKLAESYKNFQVRHSDVWITGLPRTGTTVTQELVWLLCHNLDYEAAEEDLDERVRYFELDLVFNDETTAKRIKDFPSDPEHARLTECMRDTLKYLHADGKRRVMKTHLPFELLPDDIFLEGSKNQNADAILEILFIRDLRLYTRFYQSTFRKCFTIDAVCIYNVIPLEVTTGYLIRFKRMCEALLPNIQVIYVCRHPKDVAVSYHLYEKGSWHLNFTGDFQKYWKFFKNGNCTFGPYFEHVKQGYEKQDLKNVLFVYYEDLRKDLKGYIKNIANFLERPITEKEIDKLEQHLSFENFKDNLAVSKNLRDADNNEVAFVRKGKVGGWKEYFTVKMNEEADAWIEENMNNMAMRWSQ